MSDSSEHPPLHHDVELMLALLQTGAVARVKLEDCIRHIHDDQRAAAIDGRLGEGELRERLVSTLYKLEKAKLIETGMDDSYRTTARGRRALRSHPIGADQSVLMSHPELADFIDKLSHRRPSGNTGAVEYEQGYEAFTAGRNYTDNPYSEDSVRNLAWENGWFQAFEERGDIEHE